VLPSFDESLSRNATRLEKLGVKVVTGVMVQKVDDQGDDPSTLHEIKLGPDAA
jgi:NADH dehydrogenase FAD-containing subunit